MEFPLVPFEYVDIQSYQIIANTNGTIVNTTTDQQYQLNVGDYRQINVNGSAMLTSNYPIQLIQLGQVGVEFLLQSIMFQHANLYTAYHLGDPFFLQLSSVDNWSNANISFQPTVFVSSRTSINAFRSNLYNTIECWTNPTR